MNIGNKVGATREEVLTHLSAAGEDPSAHRVGEIHGRIAHLGLPVDSRAAAVAMAVEAARENPEGLAQEIAVASSDVVDVAYLAIAAKIEAWSGNSVLDIPREAQDLFNELLHSENLQATVPEEFRGQVWGARESTSATNSLAYTKRGLKILAVDLRGNALIEKTTLLEYEDADYSIFEIVRKDRAFSMVTEYRAAATLPEQELDSQKSMDQEPAPERLWLATVEHEVVPGTRPVIFFQSTEPTDEDVVRRAAGQGASSDLIVTSKFDLSHVAKADEESAAALSRFASRRDVTPAGISKSGIVIYSERDGIFLGSLLGLAFWSKLESAGQTHACTFESVSQALAHVSAWATKPTDMVFVSVSEDADRCASIAACVAAGLPAWDPAEPGLLSGPSEGVSDASLGM
jgi:hypothetical protein